MKLTKSEFKYLVKECLLEILSEGVGESKLALQERKIDRRKSLAKNLEKKTLPTRKNMLSSLNVKKEEQKPKQSFVNDPVLDSIFADTAETTLREQAHAGHRAPSYTESKEDIVSGDPFAKAIAQHDPSDIFGDSVSKWADLAFGNGKFVDRGTSPEFKIDKE